MVTLCTAALMALASPPDSSAFAVYVGGERATMEAVCDRLPEADVVLLGETHGDATHHALEAWVLSAAHEWAQADGRALVLGLEMVETDVQTPLDEYLAGLTRERDWLAAGRPWSNYETDYRPLVEFAREREVPVVGTNVPGRYASLVARRGMAVLDSLPEAARAWFPPLPITPASEALATAFGEAMSAMGGAHGGAHGGPSIENMLGAQNLRDATMAWTIADVLEARPGALVVHA
ncbi:MAG: ChaN family lipoprotein, partial [Bacteroidota bacterium]